MEENHVINLRRKSGGKSCYKFKVWLVWLLLGYTGFKWDFS